ncbi:divalent-cation tolerance protein CutA [Candidatus Woesearchaeota archaeon]|nr:divalent-cation tolerance protein CutA [Candidatus Woesearchaeota archaeon]
MRIVYITCKNKNEAKHIVTQLLEQRLIACATMIRAKSMYWWQQKKETTSEVIIFAKTTEKRVSAVMREVKKIHSYKIPCIISWKPTLVDKSYLQWVGKETTTKPDKRT